jgi:hypothetical protein
VGQLDLQGRTNQSRARLKAGDTAAGAQVIEHVRREMSEHLEHAHWEQLKKQTGGEVQPSSERRRAHQAIARAEGEGAS